MLPQIVICFVSRVVFTKENTHPIRYFGKTYNYFVFVNNGLIDQSALMFLVYFRDNKQQNTKKLRLKRELLKFKVNIVSRVNPKI